MARTQDVEEARSLIRQFADAYRFRSATVEELELKDDDYRRPLRPEDFSFLEFGTVVTRDTVCDLPSLAVNRLLRSMYDMQFAHITRPADAQVFSRRAEFYADGAQATAARLLPFLEAFAFGFLDEKGPETPEAAFRDFAKESVADCQSLLAQFRSGDFPAEDLRFLMIQTWSLEPIRRATLARAMAAGFFEPLDPALWPRDPWRQDAGLSRLAERMDVDRAPHAFWQFYLPTTLAAVNQFSALAGRPGRSLAMIGASGIQELDALCLSWMVAEAGRHFGLGPGPGTGQQDLEAAVHDLSVRFGLVVEELQATLGAGAVEEMMGGLRSMTRILRLAGRDVRTQIQWMASLDDYRELASRLDHRIRTQQPDIDKETFVEPREMCSTTHVHDDHRLVVIESGTMVFWARPQMTLRMKPGDMVLVPRGRLHGSSVESPECVYHQPIIPDTWVRPLIRETDERHGWNAELTLVPEGLA